MLAILYSCSGLVICLLGQIQGAAVQLTVRYLRQPASGQTVLDAATLPPPLPSPSFHNLKFYILHISLRWSDFLASWPWDELSLPY